MKSFVLDCSVTMSWFLQDELQARADKILELLRSSQAFVPSIWEYEVANVLLCARRDKRLTSGDITALLKQLAALPIKISPPVAVNELPAIIKVAEEGNLSAYDAAYLELALRQTLPLATLDKKLANAAKRFGIEILV